MKLKRVPFIALLLTTLTLHAADLVPTRLRCEYLQNPRAVDTPQPRLFWGLESEARGQRQTAYQVVVASSRPLLDKERGDLWDSGRVETNQTAHVVYAGKPLASRQACYWKVRVWDAHGKRSDWSEPARWTMGLLQPGDWRAEWISFRDPAPLHASREQLHLPPARQYRKEFTTPAREVQRATLYATALGIYEARVNGQAVSDERFAPGWTDYRQRVYYRAYDVTHLVKPGTNALGAIVADGWYAGYLGYGLLVGYGPNQSGRETYGRTPAWFAQLEVEFKDGSQEVIATDATWKVSSEGPYREADFLMGEFYDATREGRGWDRAGFNDASWEPAIPAASNGSLKAVFHDGAGKREQEFGFIRPTRLEAYPAPPVRAIEELPAVKLTSPRDGTYIFDLGQNIAGVVRLRVRGPAGTRVQLRHGEMLHPDGRLMTENLRKARAIDTYVLRGDTHEEVFEPRFTFHGFRYVEVTGYPGKPGLEAITGVVLHSDTPLTSRFTCSDPMVNRLFENVVWTQRANFLELPTDCPQRDERFGWMGDAQIYARTATFNADVPAFFSKWLREVREAQLPGGAYPDYCPWPYQHGKAFATAWTDAGIIVPYTMWQAYGDTRILEQSWPSMTRFMEWRQACAQDYLGVEHPDANTWGDWLNLDEATPIAYVDTAYFAFTARLMGEMAEALGRSTEAAAYRELLSRIRKAFASRYLLADGILAVDTQTAYALALSTGLVEEHQQRPLTARLAARIRANQTRMATGFLGTKPLLPVLSAGGENDLAVQLLQSRRFPSWCFEVENGATTIWERWDSFTREHGFNGASGNQNASMNSFSHYSFGAVCEWMFRTLAGIDAAEPGYRRLLIRPSPPTPGSNPEHPAISWVRARYDALPGRIITNWKREADRFELEITVPPNTTARVWLPAGSAETVTESGKTLKRAPGVKVVGMAEDRLQVETASGRYHFVSKLKKP